MSETVEPGETNGISDPAQTTRRRKGELLARWQARARGTDLPSLDNLPAFLDGIAEILEGRLPVDGARALAVAHGDHRARESGYSLERTILDYHALRQVLFSVLEEERPLAREDRDRILDALHLSMARAASQFERVIRGRLDARMTDTRRQLESSQQIFELLVEGVKDYAIFTLDPSGVITSWNKGAARMKLYSSDEAIGRHFSMLYTEEDLRRDGAMEHLRIAAREGRYRGEGMRKRKDGTLFLADVLITPIRQADGELIGFSKVVQDLTERKTLLQERDMTRSHVESLKWERENRERFISMTSHDLRNPLSAARSAAELIQRQPDSDRVAVWAKRIVSSIDRVDGMITELLDASRERAIASPTLEITHFNLNELARDVADELSTIHGDRFRVHALGPVEGWWSKEALRRVLENLCTNAVKYGAPDAAITITVNQNEWRTTLSVLNLGEALHPEVHERLFANFTRGPQDKVRGQKGWGVGLAVVRGIVEALGGVIEVKSTPERGTLFTIELPNDSRSFS